MWANTSGIIIQSQNNYMVSEELLANFADYTVETYAQLKHIYSLQVETYLEIICLTKLTHSKRDTKMR